MDEKEIKEILLSIFIGTLFGLLVRGCISESKAQVSYYSNSQGLPNGYTYTLANTTFINDAGGQLVGTVVSMNPLPVWMPMVPAQSLPVLAPLSMPPMGYAPPLPGLPMAPVWGHK